MTIISDGKKLQVIAKEWYDRMNGNSYCAVRIYSDGELLAALPYAYGYGDYYLHRAKTWVADNIEADINTLRYTELFNLREKMKGCLKRDVKAWGEQ